MTALPIPQGPKSQTAIRIDWVSIGIILLSATITLLPVTIVLLIGR